MTLLFHCLLIWAVSASASDDQSLMQQGVGIESGVLEGAVTGTFKANLNTITSALREIPFPGKMRQMAIDALMKSVSKQPTANAITQTEIDLLNQVISLLQSVLDDLRDEQTDANAALAIAFPLSQACNNAGDQAEIDASADNQAAETAHSDCRAEELAAWQNQEALCSAIMMMLMTAETPDGCSGGDAPAASDRYAALSDVMERNDYPTRIGNNYHITGIHEHGDIGMIFINEWIDHYNDALAILNDWKANWDAGQADCKAEIAYAQSKTAECNQLQTAFESDFCQWVTLRNGQCSLLATCWSNVNTNHAAQILAHQAPSADRLALARAITYIICLVERTVAGEVDITAIEATCDTTMNGADYTDYTYVDGGVEAQDACTAIATPYPQEGSVWVNTRYAAEVAARAPHSHVPAIPDSSQVC